MTFLLIVAIITLCVSVYQAAGWGKLGIIMKKSISLPLVIVSLFLCCSCKQTSVFTEEHSQMFFNKLCCVAEIKENIKVEKVKVYYYENRYYYCATYSFYNKFYDKFVECDNVVEYYLDSFGYEYNESVAKTEMPIIYERYLNSKEKGEFKEFTKSEIDYFINNYYSSK